MTLLSVSFEFFPSPITLPRNINLSFASKFLRRNSFIEVNDFKFECIEPIAHILLDLFSSTKLLILSKILFFTQNLFNFFC